MASSTLRQMEQLLERGTRLTCSRDILHQNQIETPLAARVPASKQSQAYSTSSLMFLMLVCKQREESKDTEGEPSTSKQGSSKAHFLSLSRVLWLLTTQTNEVIMISIHPNLHIIWANLMHSPSVRTE